jgi:hypothetical protein
METAIGVFSSRERAGEGHSNFYDQFCDSEVDPRCISTFAGLLMQFVGEDEHACPGQQNTLGRLSGVPQR